MKDFFVRLQAAWKVLTTRNFILLHHFDCDAEAGTHYWLWQHTTWGDIADAEILEAAAESIREEEQFKQYAEAYHADEIAF